MVTKNQKMVVYSNADLFLETTKQYFERHEVENNLPFGLALRAQKTETETELKTFFSTLEDSRGPLLSGTITPEHNLVLARLRPRAKPQLDMMADYFLKNQHHLPGVIGVVPLVDEFAALWQQRAGVNAVVNMRQRIYRLREVRFPRHNTPGYLRPAVAEDIDLVAEWSLAFMQEALNEGTLEDARELSARRIAAGDIYLWEFLKPVSMAMRTRPLVNGISVSLVYTPPELRRKGYATATVAALSYLQIEAGWQFVSLYTDLNNPTSNSIYQKIGFRPICDSKEYLFQKGG